MSNAPWTPPTHTQPTQKTEKKLIGIRAIAEWAQLDVKNEMSGKYQIDLTNLSDTAVAKLEELGVFAKFKEDKPEKGKYITCSSQNPIKAYDPNGNEIFVRVGNGSEVQVKLDAYEWTFKGKTGVSPSIKRLTVTNLVEFDGEASDDEVDEFF